jgi:hypothetical protein
VTIALLELAIFSLVSRSLTVDLASQRSIAGWRCEIPLEPAASSSEQTRVFFPTQSTVECDSDKEDLELERQARNVCAEWKSGRFWEGKLKSLLENINFLCWPATGFSGRPCIQLDCRG